MSSTTSTPPEQLTLLAEADVPLRFRLDEATRARGLRHIAVIRAQLERQALRPDGDPSDRPVRPIRAASSVSPAPRLGRPAA